MTPHPISQLDLHRYIRPGDLVSWGQAMAEPRSLIKAYLEQRHQIGATCAFVGLSLSGDLTAEHCDVIELMSYGALGSNAALMRQGRLRLLPCRYATLPGLITSGRMRPDVMFVQLSPPGPDGSHSLGFNNDVLLDAITHARVVLAEVHPDVPWVHMDQPLDMARITACFEATEPLPQLPPLQSTRREMDIADKLAGYIPEGATLQYGIGAIPSAILKALHQHRDLGLHSGLVSEDLVDLVNCGALTNARKGLRPGVSVGGVAIGGRRLADFIADNPDYLSCSTRFTHGAAQLAQLPRLVAINSALEVDLRGQVNAEQVGDRYLGAIGGQPDFMQAACGAEDGLAIIALPAVAGHDGAASSRIVARLSGPQVTTARSDVDLVVTEFGVADLRGRDLEARAKSLIAIAAPQHREALARAWHQERAK